ncbi:MAG: AbrB/MazE/SpoVT family DNA-binding domain-containing protein [Spirochaetales bacterium]|nr:AbrB/MazE/SpoVT family DNA-binding domain-containing protein [Spirochaetales bacterium]
MEAKIQKWGNSLGIRIPMPILKDLSLKNGSVVEIEEENNRIVIQPSKKVELKSLLRKISDDNLHSETDWGGVEGDEIW